MACALGLIQRIVWDPWGDEGGIIVVAGAIAVEADFPRCGGSIPVSGCTTDWGHGGEYRDLLVGKGIISSHSGVRYVSVLGFKILSSKILFPALPFAFSTSQRIFSMRSGAMKFAYPS